MRDDDCRLAESLPQSLDTGNMREVAQAVDEGLRRLNLLSEIVCLYPRIDELSERLVDALAIQFHCDFYDTRLPLDTKRAIVKNSVPWHIRKGTPAMVEEYLRTIFGRASIKEWWEYGGKPYFFKIVASSFDTEARSQAAFMRALMDVKNVRSWLDEIDIEVNPPKPGDDVVIIDPDNPEPPPEDGGQPIDVKDPKVHKVDMRHRYGIAGVHSGNKRIGWQQPIPDSLVPSFYGFGYLRMGNVWARIERPPDADIDAKAGVMAFRVGRVTIPFDERDRAAVNRLYPLRLWASVGVAYPKWGTKRLDIERPPASKVRRVFALATVRTGERRAGVGVLLPGGIEGRGKAGLMAYRTGRVTIGGNA